MIYITGDVHGDITRFSQPAFRKIKKRDAVIVCGDFGFIWDGGKREKRVLKWLGKRRYDLLFVDGVHENFDELEKYEIEEWCGGRTRRISGKLRLLMRGEVFNIGGMKVLAFGGGCKHVGESGNGGEADSGYAAVSPDEETPGAEIPLSKPTPADFERALESLERHDYRVDYVVSHEPPTQLAEFLSLGQTRYESDVLSYYLDEISRKTDFKRWFFGRHHVDKVIPPKYFAVFNSVIAVESELRGK